MMLNEYYKIYKENKDKYGPKTSVFFQVGQFYEKYSADNIEPDLSCLADVLNIAYTKKDKSKDDSPYMLGFPIQTIHKYVRKLVNNDYTVVLYKQVQNDYGRFDRILEAIYSPSTYTDDLQNQNNFMCGIYIERSGHQGFINYHLGFSFIDVSTGEILILEEHFSQTDHLLNFIHSLELELHPKEYIIFFDPDNFTDADKFLSQNITKKYTPIHVKEKPIHFQIEFFKKVYSSSKYTKKSIMHIFDQLEINEHHIARQSLLFTLDFCYSLNQHIINHIKKPKLHRNNNLILGNDAIQQLNIIDNNNLSVLNNQYKSVFDVINNCLTTMGKRYLYKKITKPSINKEEIKSYYNLSLEIYPVYKIVSIILKKIRDIEKIGRKIMMGNIYPNELYNFFFSLQEVYKLSSWDFKNLKNLIDFDLQIMFQKIVEFCEYTERYFYIDILSQYNSIKDIKNNFIKDSEIQSIIDALNRNKDIYEETVEIFVKLLNENEKSGKKTTKLDIKDSKDGKYISTTVLKAEKIYNNLSNEDKQKYEFKKVNKICKIFVNASANSTLDSNELQMKLNLLVRKKYYSVLEGMEPFFDYFYMWSDFISIIDFCLNNCILQEKMGYTVPKICDEDNFIELEDVRHPVIERIIQTEYIPNSINMKEDKHVLLFGLNSAGKSSFQKSLGISIILAQSGCFVPAKKMVYTPYEKLYVRISGNDNIFKGLSSFAVEMSELNTILQNSGKKTLVIGDEVAKGTENTSAVSIVASSLKKLVESKTTFIFATHFHELCDLDFIKKLNLSYYHLEVKVDDNGKLIFNRQLQRGKCDDLYGLTVCKSIIHDSSFIKDAEEISRQLKGIKQSILNEKQSRYNSKVYVDECVLCKNIKELQTHHIEEQKDCDKYKSKDKQHIQKNSVNNLIVLCEKCHQKLHSNDFKILKIETSNGIEVQIK